MLMLETNAEKIRKGICPVCGAKLLHSEGCIKCPNCGWSTCEEE